MIFINQDKTARLSIALHQCLLLCRPTVRTLRTVWTHSQDSPYCADPLSGHFILCRPTVRTLHTVQTHCQVTPFCADPLSGHSILCRPTDTVSSRTCSVNCPLQMFHFLFQVPPATLTLCHPGYVQLTAHFKCSTSCCRFHTRLSLCDIQDMFS